MLFVHTIDKVLSGEKTQTRRIVKDGQGWACDQYDMPIKKVVIDHNGRIVHLTGKIYAVQRGRGMKAEARIRITGIRREDVRKISEADARAEGFKTKYDFLQLWTDMYDSECDKLFGMNMPNYKSPWSLTTEYLPEHCPVFLWSRPAERYAAWAISFELVKDGTP